MSSKARILFVDDEKRVLNAMRGLFRRHYELYLANSGAQALEMAGKVDIDVIVADQRMPGLTGIDVLSKMREQSPRTVRILLTGYADPSAIEGSINEGEVFRFLSKPCPPNLLRETLALAVQAAETRPTPPVLNAPEPAMANPAARSDPPHESQSRSIAPAATTAVPQSPPVAPTPTVGQPAEQSPQLAETPAAGEPRAEEQLSDTDRTDEYLSPVHTITNVVMSGDRSEETERTSTFEKIVPRSRNVGVVIFTVNSEFASNVIRAVADERNTQLATTLVRVAQVIREGGTGVLVTDFTSNSAILQKIVNALKQRMPELVTVVASESRDSNDMINLINYGQIYRYVVKPVDSETLRTSINAAVVKHMHLMSNPESQQRHSVADAPKPENAGTEVSQFLEQFRSPSEPARPYGSDRANIKTE